MRSIENFLFEHSTGTITLKFALLIFLPCFIGITYLSSHCDHAMTEDGARIDITIPDRNWNRIDPAWTFQQIEMMNVGGRAWYRWMNYFDMFPFMWAAYTSLYLLMASSFKSSNVVLKDDSSPQLPTSTCYAAMVNLLRLIIVADTVENLLVMASLRMFPTQYPVMLWLLTCISPIKFAMIGAFSLGLLYIKIFMRNN